MDVSLQVEQDYETLRSAALGESLPFDARKGLALFLRRGMWEWVRARLPSDGVAVLAQSVSSRTFADDANRVVVQLVADMAMSSMKRRPHARFS